MGVIDCESLVSKQMETTPKLDLNPDLSVTRFINVDDEAFTVIINKNFVAKIEPGETKTLVFSVARVGAKHLIDRVLQKRGIKDSLRDTPERQTIFAQILPDIAEEVNVKPISKEDFEKRITLRLEEQQKLLEQGQDNTDKIASLEKQIEDLKALLQPKEEVKKKVVRQKK